MDLTWRETTRTGQSVECFRDAPKDGTGEGFLCGQVVLYGGSQWHAYARRRRVGGTYASAGEAQRAVEEALRGG